MHLWTVPYDARDAAPWVELAPAPALPSALDTIVSEPTAETTGERDDAAVRARWYVRPRVAVTVLDGGWQPDLGIAVGHQWWKFTDVTVAPAGETRLVATLPLGSPGYDLALSSAGGVWLARRAGVFVGPRLDADRRHWSDTLTDRAVAVGALARVAMDLGPIRPWVEIAPAWIVDGSRPPVADAPWDAFSTRAGLLFGRHFQLKVDGAHTATGSGEVWEASAGVHLHLG